MNNLSIKNKIFLVAIIPILSILYLSYSVAHEQFIKINKINSFKIYLDKSIKINKLISNLQIERGLSSTYTGKNKKIKIQLSRHVRKTDDSIKPLLNYLSLNNIHIYTDKLKEFRKNTLEFKNDQDEIFNYYTNIISKLLITISKLPTITNNNELSLNTLSLIYLIKAKEFAGQERAVGAYIFSKEKFTNESFIKIQALQNQYESEINSFYSLSTNEIKNKYYQIINKNNNEVSKFKYMEDMLSQNIYKKSIISHIRLLAGYGGLIHNFKNYLLRGNIKYKQEFNVNYNKLIVEIKKYKELNISNEELKLLNKIEITFGKYAYSINKLNFNENNIVDIKHLDLKIKVDDADAIEALHILSNNIIGIDPNSWFKYATIRINKIIELEKIVFEEIKMKQITILDKLYNSFYKNILLIILIILFTLYFINKIVKDISNKLNHLKIGLFSFFDYINGKNRSYNILEVDGDDEIDHLAKSLNKGIMDTSKYIKKEIKNASLKDKQIYESAKMAQMGEMIGNIAHQWRQPLSVISTIASSIQLKQDLGILKRDAIEQNMNKIVQNTSYLSETIDIFSNFIKDEKLYKEIVLQDEIKVAFTIIESNLVNNHIELKSNINFDKNIKINLISGELPQVIINIINNAKDIILEKKINKAVVNVDLEEKEDTIIISIEDNAGGIPFNIINKIFDPYFTTKHKSNGTGLGLHMSYKIITESLNGKLYVKNTDIGAKFFIELPLK